MRSIKIKRVYEIPEATDGYRVLVDRLWPRGLKKEIAALDEWNKDVAPSTELRKWFDHKPENFLRFEKLYTLELKHKKVELKRLQTTANKQCLTLLYAARDEKINHATILLKVLKRLTRKK